MTRYPRNNSIAPCGEAAHSEGAAESGGRGRGHQAAEQAPPGKAGHQMDKEELLLRYECEGGESLYAEAKPLFEEALTANPGDAGLLLPYRHLLEWHGRRMIRAAAGYYQQAMDPDPGWARPRFHPLGALAAPPDAPA